MEFNWMAHAECRDCMLTFKDIKPKLVIDFPETERKCIICPCCFKLLTVYSVSNNMKKKMLCIHDVDEYTKGKEIAKMIYKMAESGDKKAVNILYKIRKIRAQIGLDPIKFDDN